MAVIAIAGGYGYLRRSLPQTGGTIAVTGISAPVDIVRDADSITHVFGATKLDTFYGLGYAHAQDRLWQMEFQRRVGMGRLSEVFGAATLNTDRFLRTLGTNRAARSAWASLPGDTKAAINAYVAGVNAFIATHHGSRLPLEFTLLRFEPEPWTGPDVLAWVKMMAWDLSKNYSLELLRHDVEAKLGPARERDLFPPYPANGLTVLSEEDMPRTQTRATVEDAEDAEVFPGGSSSASSAVESFSASSLPFLSSSFGSALGSNNWVVDGTMTASGKPLLANDPHLDAQIPSLWYLAHLSAADGYEVIGATLPGAPAVVIGRNKDIAWGETNVMADVQDLYREPPDAPLRTITETIGVKGESPITIDVRISRHGPLISDAINANNAKLIPRPPVLDPIAFRWTALDEEDSTVTSILHLNDAHNWSEFTAALRDFVVPAQNFVYADVNGHIGYYAPGHFPIRDERGEWTGWIPFDDLPHAYDPPEHFIVSANNRITPESYPYPIESEWIDPYRAERISDRLKSSSKLTPDAFASIQSDTHSLHAKALLPVLLARVRPIDARDAQAVALLRQWDLDARGDSAAAAVFQAWFYELPQAVAGDELGDRLLTDYLGLDRSSYRSRFLLQTLSTADNPWCDDVRTPARETCDDAVSRALHAGLVRLTTRLGGDMGRWRWDAVHRAVFAHPALDTVPLLGRWLRREVPHGGDWSTINVGPVYAPRPFEQHSLPGYREIVDLSSANDSRFLDAVGESGHPLSPHYDDALALWATGRYRKMRMSRADVEQGALGDLRLTPRTP